MNQRTERYGRRRYGPERLSARVAAAAIALCGCLGVARGQEIISTMNNGGGLQNFGGGEIYSSIGEPFARDSLQVTPTETTWTGFWHLGPAQTSGVEVETVVGAVDRTEIAAAFPSPFVSVLSVDVTLERSGTVTLAIYDPLGREVERLIEGNREAGTLHVVWRPESLEAGTYFLRLSVDGRQVASRQTQYYR